MIICDGLLSGAGRSTGEGNGNPLRYPCLENPTDGEGFSPCGRKESDTTSLFTFRYADDTTLMAETKEELKSLSMKVKKSEKFGLKLNIQKTKIMASGPITSWKIDGKTVTVYFLGLQNHCRWLLQP